MIWLRNDLIDLRAAELKSFNFTYQQISSKLVEEFNLERPPSESSVYRWIRRGKRLIEENKEKQSIPDQLETSPS